MNDRDHLNGLVCPYFDMDEVILYYVVREQARRLVRQFLRLFRRDLIARSHGLVELLSTWLDDDECTFSSCWHDSFGCVVHCASRLESNATPRERLVLEAAVAIGLHLVAQGYSARWDVNLKMTRSRRFGPWYIPACNRFGVQSNGRSAVLEVNRGSASESQKYSRVDNRWYATNSSVGCMAYFGSQERPIAIVSHSNAAHEINADRIIRVVERPTVSVWHSAWLLLSQQSPRFESWVSRIVQSVVLLQKQPGITVSASYRYLFGMIYATAQTSKLSKAEILVHEASHQYYYLLRLIGDIDDGSDKNEYYSPLVDRKRSIDRIFFSYHACFNILCFYRSCVENGYDEDGYIEKHEIIVREQLDTLAHPLRQNTALTTHGRQIFEAMEQAMYARG